MRAGAAGRVGEDYKKRNSDNLARCYGAPSSTKIRRIHHTLVKPVRSESQPFYLPSLWL